MVSYERGTPAPSRAKDTRQRGSLHPSACCTLQISSKYGVSGLVFEFWGSRPSVRGSGLRAIGTAVGICLLQGPTGRCFLMSEEGQTWWGKTRPPGARSMLHQPPAVNYIDSYAKVDFPLQIQLQELSLQGKSTLA